VVYLFFFIEFLIQYLFFPFWILFCNSNQVTSLVNDAFFLPDQPLTEVLVIESYARSPIFLILSRNQTNVDTLIHFSDEVVADRGCHLVASETRVAGGLCMCVGMQQPAFFSSSEAV